MSQRVTSGRIIANAALVLLVGVVATASPKEQHEAEGTVRLVGHGLRGAVVWLLRAEPHAVDGTLAAPYLRRVSEVRARHGVAMPAGRVVPGLYDPAARRLVALGRPIEVAAGRVHEVSFLPPGWASRGRPPTTDVYLGAEWDGPSPVEEDPYVDLVLRVAGPEQRDPDLLVATADDFFAVWYDVPVGTAVVRGGFGPYAVPRTSLVIPEGELHRLAAGVVARPRLAVAAELPPPLGAGGAVIEVTHHGPTLRRELAPGSRVDTTFSRLLPGPVTVTLGTPYGRISERRHLQAGSEERLVLAPAVVRLAGTVRLDGEGGPATLRFEAGFGRGAVVREAVADDAGRYAVALVPPVSRVTVRARAGGAPHTAELRLETSRSDLDFELPDPRKLVDQPVVEVVDAATGRGIAEALVYARRVELVASRPPPERDRVVADEAGRVVLPEQETGTVQLWARADGYLPSAHAVRIEVPRDPDRGPVRLTLDAVAATSWLALVLPDGSPAAGARVARVTDPDDPRLVPLSVEGDAAGLVRLRPEHTGEILVVRHHDSGFLVRRWRPGPEGRDVAWRLPPRADRDLEVRVVGADGAPVPFARMVLLIDGHRLPLAGLVRPRQLHGKAGIDGAWRVAGLPARGVEVAAYRDGRRAPPGIAAAAVAVPYPWPEPVDVPVVETAAGDPAGPVR